MILLTLHAPHLQKPADIIYDIILLTSVTTLALAYVSCHVNDSLYLCHHLCHLADVIAPLVDFDH